MKIEDFGTLQMTRTNVAHTGTSKLTDIAGQSYTSLTSAAEKGQANTLKSFDQFLVEAMSSMNQQQIDVTNLQEQVITDPDSLDIHDVTIAMSKARMSLNLAQSVIDRLISGWSEITTTR